MDKTYRLKIICDQDSEPINFFQVIGSAVSEITDEVFDMLLEAPGCTGVDLEEKEDA